MKERDSRKVNDTSCYSCFSNPPSPPCPSPACRPVGLLNDDYPHRPAVHRPCREMWKISRDKSRSFSHLLWIISLSFFRVVGVLWYEILGNFDLVSRPATSSNNIGINNCRKGTSCCCTTRKRVTNDVSDIIRFDILIEREREWVSERSQVYELLELAPFLTR